MKTLEQAADNMESKHTEVWVEGRTIFEQDAKKPEVDLEKEIREWYGLPDYIDIRTLFDTAKHFYELGQREMRNRITNPEYNKQVVDKMKSEYPELGKKEVANDNRRKSKSLR